MQVSKVNVKSKGIFEMDLSCYKNQAVRLEALKSALEAINKRKGKQTSLLADSSLKDSSIADFSVNTVEQLEEMSCPTASLSGYVLEGQVGDKNIIQQLRYGLNYIGRDPSNDLVLMDNRISRLHSILLVHSDNRAIIFDLNSLNGLAVNSKRVSQIEVKVNDEIRFADYYFVLKSSKSEDLREQNEVIS